jgi:hypothetical protein
LQHCQSLWFHLGYWGTMKLNWLPAYFAIFYFI